MAKCISYFVVQSLSRVWLFETPSTAARQAPLFMGFPGQECWSGLPFPSPGDLLEPGIEPISTALAGWTARETHVSYTDTYIVFFSPSYLGHHRSLNRVPCAIQWVLICYLIYTQSMYMSIPVSQFIAPTWCPYICSPCLCLYFCFASRPVCTNCFERKLLHKFKFCNCVVDVYLFSVLIRAESGRAPDISDTHIFN